MSLIFSLVMMLVHAIAPTPADTHGGVIFGMKTDNTHGGVIFAAPTYTHGGVVQSPPSTPLK